MRVNTRKKYPSLDEYDSMDEEVIDIVQMGALELSEHIEEKLNNRPPKNSKRLSSWKTEVNRMIESMNSRFGKRYNKIK